MGKRRTVQPRSAAELKRDTGKLHAMKGVAMREAKMLRELNQRMCTGTPKGGGHRPAKQPPRPGGITVGK